MMLKKKLGKEIKKTDHCRTGIGLKKIVKLNLIWKEGIGEKLNWSFKKEIFIVILQK